MFSHLALGWALGSSYLEQPPPQLALSPCGLSDPVSLAFPRERRAALLHWRGGLCRVPQ